MKKQLLVFLFSLLSIAATAQKMSADGYTVSISGLKTESYTIELFGSKRNITEHTGNYLIEKGGKQIAAQGFTLMNMDSLITLNIKADEDTGNTLTYDPDTHTFELAYDEYKARNTRSNENLILSGILIYAKWMDSEQ